MWPWVLHDDLTGLVGNIKMQQLQSKSNGAGFEPTRKTLEVQIHIPHQINNSSQNPMMNLFDEFYPNINNSSQNLMGISDANPGFDPKYQQIQSKSNGPARSSVRIPHVSIGSWLDWIVRPSLHLSVADPHPCCHQQGENGTKIEFVKAASSIGRARRFESHHSNQYLAPL